MSTTTVSLDDKYARTSGRVLLSGIEALVRLLLDQRRLDTVRGLDTAAFVSGYPGSPLGGVDLELARAREHLDRAGVVVRPGVNEELAATAVAGTQMLGSLPGRRHDGVTGFWYGKAPGLDRAADAIRHCTLAGTSPLGGAVAWIGDDPACKSSTVPSSSERLIESLSMPLLAPSSVAEIVPCGLHAVAMSRSSGLVAGLKIVADVADAAAVVDLDEMATAIPGPIDVDRAPRPPLVGDAAVDAEHDLLTRRLALARRYGVEHALNRVTFEPGHRAVVGIVASGVAYAIVLRALDLLGLDESWLGRLGIRLVQVQLPFPLDAQHVQDMLGDLDEVIVVEDKVPFVEGHLKQLLYGRGSSPRIAGRHAPNGAPLLSSRGQLQAEPVARAIASRLAELVGAGGLPSACTRHVAVDARPRSTIELSVVPTAAAVGAPRTAYFCSGCPHNRSTKTSADTLVGVGIGCHALVTQDETGRGRHVGLTQMGGEGAQWIGMEPFTTDRSFTQNIGDGTFAHSGSLAVRAAVAARVKITYKLLYNDAVAMTGGQQAAGGLDVPGLTRLLADEGVTRVVVTTDEPRKYRRVGLSAISTVRHRDRLPQIEEELAAVDGVSVILYDDRCATEERRLRRRGQLPSPSQRVVINERVCEGCGDCGVASTCLSVHPVESEFGRKTRIHQASCNSDLSCLDGDCPSFLLVQASAERPRTRPEIPVALSEPPKRASGDVLVRMPGIGGTGVVTASKILQMAAHLDGHYASGLEQTGLAQKGGPVVSDVRISPRPIRGSIRATDGSVDVLLALDVLGAAEQATLAVVDTRRTVAVVNSAVTPTAAMVTGTDDLQDIAGERAHARVTDAVARCEAVDAQSLCEALFGDHMPTNALMLGAAYQLGQLPVSEEALEHAIRLNGAAVSVTLEAFRWGRAMVVDSGAVWRAVAGPDPTADPPVTMSSAALARDLGLNAQIGRRIDDLHQYQDQAYAERYVAAVREFLTAADRRVGRSTAVELGDIYARSLHKLMAYKDEYEVARLHLDPVERARRESEFGVGTRTSVLLHPPVLRSMGLGRKIRFTRGATSTFIALRALRRLRGTPLDPFGRTRMRTLERQLIGEYQHLAELALRHLTQETVSTVARLLALPDLIRGYESVKLDNVEKFRAEARSVMTLLSSTATRTAHPAKERQTNVQ